MKILFAIGAVMVFVFGLGFVNDALAVADFQCKKSSLEAPGIPAWNKAGKCDYPITYRDAGGSNLKFCQYQVINIKFGTSPDSNKWQNAVGGDCKGESASLRTGDIIIGSTGDCTENGADQCWLFVRASDGADNKGELLATFDIDYATPVSSIICNSDVCVEGWNRKDVTVEIKTDTPKNRSADTIFECHDSSTCVPTEKATGTTDSPAATHSFSLSSEGTTFVRYMSKDAAGNSEDLKSQQVKIDKTNPTIVKFDVNPKKSEGKWVNAEKPNVTISWQVQDFVSGLKEVQVWRSGDGGSNWVQILGSPFSAPSNDWTGSVPDSPPDGTYKYGIHVKDKAENKITETQAGFSVIDVQVDKALPTSSVTSPKEHSIQNRPKFNPDATLRYSDIGLSGLSSCQYRVESNGVQTLGWTSAGNCSGAGPVDLVKKITVGANPLGDCRDGGTDKCIVFVRATDAAGNVGIEGSRPFTIVLNQAPELNPASLSQFKNDGSTAIPNQGITNQSTVKLRASATDPDTNEIIRLFFEVVLSSGSFLSPATPTTGTSCASGILWKDCSNKIWYVGSSNDNFSSTPFTGTVNITGLSNRTEYQWQAKACDNSNACSSWKVFDTAVPNFSVAVPDTGSSTRSGPLPTSGTPSTPGTPTTPSPTNNTTPTWLWTESTGSPTSYTVYWSGTAGGETNSASVTTNSFTHSTALAEGTWYMKVKAFNAAGIPSAFSDNGSVVIDTTAPTVTINQASGQADPTNVSPIHFTVVFSELVFGFTNSNVTIGGTAGGTKIATVTESNATYNVAVGGMTDGTVIASIAANAATDAAGNSNTVSTSTDNTVTYDATAPTVTINQASGQADPTNVSPVNFTAIFSETVSGFTNSDVTIGGTAGGTKTITVTERGATYNVAVGGMTSGTVIASIAASVATDVATNGNTVSTSTDNTVTYDVIAPTISTWSIAPEAPHWANSTNPTIKVTWSVLDQGSSFLDRVEIFRSAFGAGCNDTDKSGCVWGTPIGSVNAPTNVNTWNCPDCVPDAPASGTYWYGMHVFDKAQNKTVEPNPPGPKKALVDKQNPSTAVISPVAGTWFKNDFNVTFDDSDIGGSGLVLGPSGCQYRFIGNNPSGQDISSGDLARQCDPVTKNITVGVSPDICRFEGKNRCRVETKSFDVAGNDSGWKTVLFGVDFTAPVIGSPTPNSVQSGVSTTYSASLQDPVGKVTGCGFFWRAVGSTEWNTGSATAINPIPCESNANCTVSVDHTFASPGSFETQFSCTDQATNRGWGGVTTVQAGSLSVDLSAVPFAGSVDTLFDLVATVSGTITGNINYKFDCTNNGTWELEVNNSTQNPFTAVDLCQYSPPATYTAKVFVQRGVGTAQNTVNIRMGANSIPSAINLSVDPANPTDYSGVTGYPPVRVRWTFSDADPGDTQSAYQIQVFSGGTKVVDTGKKLGSTQSYVFQSSGEQLLWDTTYTWQVRVWDNLDNSSSFASALEPQFTTVKHHYPVPNFTWTPAVPSRQESVQFTDQTNFAAGSFNKTWSWNFGDGGSSTLQNPSHTYVQTGAFVITLQSGDDVGSSSTQKTPNISIPFPEWQEISPF